MQSKLHLLLVSKTFGVRINFFFSDETEVWDFETGNNWTFEPSLFPTGLADGIALYFVDANFCNSSNSDDESSIDSTDV